MTTMRAFVFDDLFKFNRIVFDAMTAVYSLQFWVTKMIQFPELAEVSVSPCNRLSGLIMGYHMVKNNKIDNKSKEKLPTSYGHVCVLSVDHDYRRLGLGSQLMKQFDVRLESKQSKYVDLLVKSRNISAIKLYKSLGYVKHRWLPYSYHDDHGYEMRRILLQHVQGAHDS